MVGPGHGAIIGVDVVATDFPETYPYIRKENLSARRLNNLVHQS
jgi:hypothetical protein